MTKSVDPVTSDPAIRFEFWSESLSYIGYQQRRRRLLTLKAEIAA